MVVDEIDTDWCARRGYQFVEFETVACALEDGDRVGSIIDDGDNLAVVLRLTPLAFPPTPPFPRVESVWIMACVLAS
jgi:hypothetical protein